MGGCVMIMVLTAMKTAAKDVTEACAEGKDSLQ